VVLPTEYTEWSERVSAEGSARVTGARQAEPSHPAGFALVSPVDGDVYRVPPGADPRFATVALRAAGSGGDGRVRWYVDGRQHRSPRWELEKGVHRIRAVSPLGESAEATVKVE
jgi:membrane carboxypeptidase/penicillin-binding protein PbpC